MNTMRTITFTGAGLSLTFLFAASAAAIPLYSQYARQFHLSAGDLASTSVVYFIGTVAALVFLARLSDFRGRKQMMYATLLLGLIGCILCLFLQNAAMLMAARCIQGLSCGLASSTATAYLIDSEPPSMPGIGASLSGGGPNLGLALGAILSGLLLSYSGAAPAVVFFIAAASLVLCLVCTYAGQETMPLKRGAMRSLRPQIKAPEPIRPLLFPFACIAAAGWSIGGFYQAYSAVMADRLFHSSAAYTGSLLFLSFCGVIALGAMVSRKWDSQKSQLFGMTAYVAFLALLYLALPFGLLPLCLGLNMAAGIAEGIMFTGALKHILSLTAQQDRAGVLSLLYIISYGGAVLPNELIGILSGQMSLPQIFLCYVLFCTACYGLFLVLYVRRLSSLQTSRQ